MTKGNWLAVTLFGIGYLVAGISSFSSLNVRVIKLESASANHGVNHHKEVGELQAENVFQNNTIHDLSDRYIRLDTEAANTRESVSNLEITMGEMLKEVEELNKNVIKLGVLQDLKQLNPTATKISMLDIKKI